MEIKKITYFHPHKKTLIQAINSTQTDTQSTKRKQNKPAGKTNRARKSQRR